MIDADRMISLHEAAALGIDRLRKPGWRMPEDHLKIVIVNGCLSLWGYLYSPFNKECNGRDPVEMLLLDEATVQEFVPYLGPRHDSPEYAAAEAVFDGCLKR